METASSYKGITRFGKRWKVQFENGGVLFYLGTFDTEEEAIRAYDFKARSMESPLVSSGVAMETLMYPETNLLPGTVPNLASIQEASSNSYSRTEARAMWDRLTSLYQRQLLAKAVQAKLSDIQVCYPDQHKEVLLKALNEEIVMLGLVKAQLEEAMVAYFSSEVAVNELPDMASLEHWNLTAVFNESQSNMFPLSHAYTPVNMPEKADQMYVGEDGMDFDIKPPAEYVHQATAPEPPVSNIQLQSIPTQPVSEAIIIDSTASS